VDRHLEVPHWLEPPAANAPRGNTWPNFTHHEVQRVLGENRNFRLLISTNGEFHSTRPQQRSQHAEEQGSLLPTKTSTTRLNEINREPLT
jgi:hypothetical protein